MEVIPAVDIMKGRVVRLVKGDPEMQNTYDNLGDPVSLAKKWESEGARIIHVIDLDAALGLGSNIQTVHKIIEVVNIQVQVGGGIRSLKLARQILKTGVKRIILGSLAFKKPLAINALLEEFGNDRVIVALDNINGRVMVNGWKKSTKVSVNDAMQRFFGMGVKIFLVTSVFRDGTLSGSDFENLSHLPNLGVNVIVAGGVGGIHDLVALKELGISSVVVGKALYEGIFSLGEALRKVNRE
jgi:phosphoribosylformimino-5-aminoimidazole carboxamide ribotide isomerase